jgi:hypothetical protein
VLTRSRYGTINSSHVIGIFIKGNVVAAVVRAENVAAATAVMAAIVKGKSAGA